MDNYNTLLTTLSLSIAASSGIFAEPLVTDRPDATESSSVIAPGFAQFEMGVTAIEDADGESAVEYGGSLLRVGLVEDWELRLGWGGYLESDSVSGANDAMLGFKYYITPEGDSWFDPEAAILVHTSLPVGDRDITSDALDPDFLLSFSHTLSEQFSLGYNLGGMLETSEKADGSETTLSSGLYSVAVGYGATEQLGLFLEVFGAVGLSAEESPASLDGGITWLFNDDSQLDLFAGVGINGDADDWFVGLGYSIRWAR
jgi:hypothetical protein